MYSFNPALAKRVQLQFLLSRRLDMCTASTPMNERIYMYTCAQPHFVRAVGFFNVFTLTRTDIYVK